MGTIARAAGIGTLAATLAACALITGVGDLAVCTTCGEDARVPIPAAPTLDGAIEGADGSRPDGAGVTDAAPDGATDGSKDASVDAPLGCQGAASCLRVVFVTSTSSNGALGGIGGADAKCQALADASSLPRVRGHKFVAWVSTAVSAVASRFVQGGMSYVRTDGAVIASNWTDLTKGNIGQGISLDENGLAVNDGNGAWTGTLSAGATYAGASCAEWTASDDAATGERGNVGGSGGGWSGGGTNPCSELARLYCFEY